MAEKVGDVFVELGVRGLPAFEQKLDMGKRELQAVKRAAPPPIPLKVRGASNVVRKVGLVDRSLTKLKGTAIAVAASLASAFAARQLVVGLGRVIKFAGDAEETFNKFQQVFSSIPELAQSAGKNLAESFRLADVTAQKLLADTGDILVGFGFTEKAALELSVQVNTLASDLASFTNIEGGAARASQALTKLLVGETEQAKALGIVVRQTTKDYNERVAQIQKTQGATLLQAKALANLQIALEQTRKAQGDFARTQDSFANQLKTSGELYKQTKTLLGGLLITLAGGGDAVSPLTDGLQAVNDRLGDLADNQKQLAILREQLRAIGRVSKELIVTLGKLVTVPIKLLVAPFLAVRKLLKELPGLSSAVAGGVAAIAKTVGGLFDFLKLGGDPISDIIGDMEAAIDRIKNVDPPKIKPTIEPPKLPSGAELNKKGLTIPLEMPRKLKDRDIISPREQVIPLRGQFEDFAVGLADDLNKRDAARFTGFADAIKEAQAATERERIAAEQARRDDKRDNILQRIKQAAEMMAMRPEPQGLVVGA